MISNQESAIRGKAMSLIADFWATDGKLRGSSEQCAVFAACSGGNGNALLLQRAEHFGIGSPERPRPRYFRMRV
jgi:hypothetical protein